MGRIGLVGVSSEVKKFRVDFDWFRVFDQALSGASAITLVAGNE